MPSLLHAGAAPAAMKCSTSGDYDARWRRFGIRRRTAELQARALPARGLDGFPLINIGQFEPEVAEEILNLAREVDADGEN